MSSTSAFSALTKALGCECVDISHLPSSPKTLFDENARFFAVIPQTEIPSAVRRRPSGGSRLSDVIAEFSASKGGQQQLEAGRQWVAETFYKDEPASLQAFRLRKGMSQSDLAKAIGVNQPRISIYERGLEKPEFDMLVRLRNALDVSTDQIFAAIEYAVSKRDGKHV